MKNTRITTTSLFLLGFTLGGCQFSSKIGSESDNSKVTGSASTLNQEVLIADFTENRVPDFIKAHNADVFLVESPQGNSNKNRSLKVVLKSQQNWRAAMSLKPKTPWDWSGYKDFNIAFDVANNGTESTQIDLIMSDHSGNFYTRVFVVPANGETSTVYAKMDGHDQTHPDGTPINEFNFISGLRSNPPTWDSSDRQVYSLWGKKSLDLTGISEIKFEVSGNLSDRTFTIDNIRLRPNPKMDANFLVNIVDRFGQSTKARYSTKVSSEEELASIAQKEMQNLKGTPWPERSKFHGWKLGPKLEGTGNFRTHKVDGKWWLIDPEGYLYFSTGVDIIRLSNSSTITGYDFDHDKIESRDVNEIISEDDQPLNRVNDNAIPTRRLVNQTRSNMFAWLPDYDAPLGEHFGYRRSVQSGPMKQGETFSFYSANLERRYGETSPRSYMSTWRDVTIKRMVDWGYTSLGNWAEPEYYANEEIPFVAFADINGDFGTLKSGFDFWHPLPDPYDPVFFERARVSAEFVRDQIQSSPWCMGIFYDNEQSFGRPETDELYFGLVLNTLKEDASTKHAKAAFTNQLKQKYVSIEALNKAWATEFESWSVFASGVDAGFTTAEQRKDYSDLLYAYGKQYFGTIRKATKSVLPNHLYLGARMADWGRPDEIVRAAAEETDMLSFNLYEDGYKPSHWQILAEVDRPTLIGEFSFGADDAGHFHPGVVLAEDQADRGRKYIEFMNSVIDSPYFVGAHMFQYMDGPITGRAYDGENYNTGVVSVTDIPYAPLVKAIKEVNKSLYKKRHRSD